MMGSSRSYTWLPTTTDNSLPLATGADIWAEIRRNTRGLVKWLVAAALTSLAAAILDLVIPLQTGKIVDLVSGNHALAELRFPVIAIVLSVVFGGICTGLSQSLTPSFFSAILVRLREKMMRGALTLDQQVIDQAGTADLVARAGDDSANVRDAANGVLPRLMTTGTLLVVSAAGIASLNIAFLLPVVLGAVCYYWAIRWFLHRASPIYQTERKASTTQSQDILSTLHGIDTVHAFGLEDVRSSIIAKSSWKSVTWGLRGRFVANGLTIRLLVGELVTIVGVVVTAAILIRSGASTVGDASAAILMLVRVFSPLRFLLIFLDSLQSAYVSLQRIVGVIKLADEHEPSGMRAGIHADIHAGNHNDLDIPAGALRVRDLDFSYVEGHPVLHGINLDVAPGEHIALVGESGAGKTTLAALIAGILSPTAGTIRLGETPDHHGPQIVLLSQEIHTFSGKLRDDVAMGLPDSSTETHIDQKIAAALNDVGADSWVQNLPDGDQTIVGRLGTTLSPAQAQQIALARVLLSDPPIVILDEATAEAGSVGAQALDDAAARVIHGRTALIVVHRLSQVELADRVAVMHDGRLVEIGTPDQLLAAGGTYAKLWQAWSAQRG